MSAPEGRKRARWKCCCQRASPRGGTQAHARGANMQIPSVSARSSGPNPRGAEALRSRRQRLLAASRGGTGPRVVLAPWSGPEGRASIVTCSNDRGKAMAMTTTMRASRKTGTATARRRLGAAARERKPGAVVPHLSVAERVARGKAARSEVPRASHAMFEPPPSRADPVELLERQAKTRVPELVPIRYGRMLVSPFTFYRGAAMIMANDLAATPRSGLTVQCCGDAHLSNFGVFASPERRVGVRRQRFRRDAPGAVGVGRQAAWR